MVQWLIGYQHWVPSYRGILSHHWATWQHLSTWARRRTGSRLKPRLIRRETSSRMFFFRMTKNLQAFQRIPHWTNRPRISQLYYRLSMSTAWRSSTLSIFQCWKASPLMIWSFIVNLLSMRSKVASRRNQNRKSLYWRSLSTNLETHQRKYNATPSTFFWNYLRHT